MAGAVLAAPRMLSSGLAKDLGGAALGFDSLIDRMYYTLPQGFTPKRCIMLQYSVKAIINNIK